ncbi:hypothetical protein [Lewinella sp. IMCC34183]|uniref:hypothetical protein n=1 Tax=Lewinella sp. IMCC34183 TaxID=2248762 RepID=UPI000E257E8B|nr:hypothetical protein [Lewinella sp. IMCC34183]
MLKGISSFVFLLLVSACMESGDPPTSQSAYGPLPAGAVEVPRESDRSFVAGERIGGITAGMPMSLVENLYGSDQLTPRDLPAGEGTTVPGYVLFPGTRDELFIELGHDKQPARVRFSHPRSEWHDAATGLSIGTTLEELREMNGRPFTFFGFGWDYGGTVGDWSGGKLEQLLVRLTYSPERVPPTGLPDTLIGDHPVSSTADSLDGLGLRVREIIVPIRRPAEE